MTQDLGNITLIPDITNYFRTASTGLAGILIGNESGFTCSVTMGTNAPKNLYPGSIDFFPCENNYYGIITILPKATLSTANLYPSNILYFEAVGFHEGFDASSYPISLPRNTTGQFAGTQFAYNTAVFTFTNVSGTQSIVLPQIPGNFSRQNLTLYGSDVFSPAVTPIGTSEMAYNTLGGTEVAKATTPGTSTSGWIEILSEGGTSAVNANIPAQSGNGWSPGFLPAGSPSIPAGNWSASIGLTYGLSATASLTLRISTYNFLTNIYTILGTIPITAQAISATRANFSFPNTSLPIMNLPNGTFPYFDLFAKLTTNWNVADNITIFENNNGIKGIANDVQINTPGINQPTTGSLTTGNTLYTAQMSTYFGGIDCDIIQAISKTQLQISVSNLDPNLTKSVNANIFPNPGWKTAAAVGANANQYQRFFANPFKSPTGQQLAVNIFQDSGTEIITGQIYYYVQ